MLAALLLAVFPPPLELEAVMSQQAYAPGEEVVVSLKLRNNSSSKMIVAKAFAPIYPHASIATTLWNEGGKEVFADSNRHSGSWFWRRQIGRSTFAIVEPGEAVEVAEERFKRIWKGTRGNHKVKKPDPTYPLDPGKYRFEYSYSYEKKLVQKDGEWFHERELGIWNKRQKLRHLNVPTPYTFEQGARALYEAAFTGEVTATVEFRIGPVPPN